jgi:checkpoint serine/threonine-protein kinase
LYPPRPPRCRSTRPAALSFPPLAHAARARSCVEWVKAEWPAGGAEAGLVPLLERATRSLVGCAGMGGHPEYVKLWITYADALPDPSDVFKYMHAQRIGADCALFYMAWAWLAEHRGA